MKASSNRNNDGPTIEEATLYVCVATLIAVTLLFAAVITRAL